MDILTKIGMLDYLPCDTFMDPNINLLPCREAIERLRKILTPSRQTQLSHYHKPDTTFTVSVLSQFLNVPCGSHWDDVTHPSIHEKSFGTRIIV